MTKEQTGFQYDAFKSLALQLKALRKAHGYTAEEVAQKTNVELERLLALENNLNKLDLNTAIRLADFYHKKLFIELI